MGMKSLQNREDLLRDLEKSVFDYDGEKAVLLAREVVDQKVDLVSAIDCLTHAITLIGDRFGSGELFLPDLVGTGRVVDQAMAILEEGIRRTGQQERYKGVVVIGTVLGDIHSIGKNMVAAFCRAAGFKVIDMGENVSAEKFMEAVKKNNPDILALSSLLTTTMAEQQRMIKNLGEKGLRKSLKIMVGGGPVTREFAKSIGADGYAPTAPTAAKLALKLIGRDERS